MSYLKRKVKYKMSYICIYELSSKLYNYVVIFQVILCNVHNVQDVTSRFGKPNKPVYVYGKPAG